MDKESNLWKTRFENCNKALTDMMEEVCSSNLFLFLLLCFLSNNQNLMF